LRLQGVRRNVRKLKEKPGIDNPFAVSWASYNGDDMDEEYDDGLSGLTAGGKPAPEGDDYENQTLGNEPFKHAENMDNEMDDSDDYLLDDTGADLHQHKGHAVGAVHKMAGAAGGGGSDEELLDDSEGTEGDPHEVNAPSDPAAHGPEAHGVSDPEPDMGTLKNVKT
jgi:hypothetical protein